LPNVHQETHNDICKNHLEHRKELATMARSFLSSETADKIYELGNNDEYATAMARIHYVRVPTALPKAFDVDGQANYWKQHYNTPLGKGKPQEYIEKWQHYLSTENT
jgi:hypothetical protein